MARRGQNFTPDYHTRRQHQREDHLWKADMQAMQQADKIRYGIADKVHAERERGRKAVEDTAKTIDREAAESVKRILSTPITQWTGGARGTVTVNYRGTPMIRLDDGRVSRIDGCDPEVFEQMKRDYRKLPSLTHNPKSAKFFSKCGLTIDETYPDTVSGEYGPVDRKITVKDVPSLVSADITGAGLELTFKHRPGDSAKAWLSKLDVLRAGFKASGIDAHNLEIRETSDGAVKLVFNDKDPFDGLSQITHVFDADKGRSLLGITSDGEPAWITWNGSSGMVIGGVPGSGKTASMLPVFAAMAGQADLFVFDGKSGFDLDPLRHIAVVYDRSGDIEAPLGTLRDLESLRVSRTEQMYQSTGISNFWNIPLAQRKSAGLKPVFIVLDEVQTWLDTSGMSKEEKATSSEIQRLVRTLIQKGRSAGIVTILTTQKPDATSIPTVIRDNAALKLCFRVSTPEQATTVIGTQAPGAPSPTSIPMSSKGRAVMETEGKGITMLQAGYVSPATLEGQLSEFAKAHPIHHTEPTPVTKPTPAKPTPPKRTTTDTTTDDAARKEAVRKKAIEMGLLPADDPATAENKPPTTDGYNPDAASDL
ncbi:P-loop NTPase family protein [Mycolicibacter icosiumassiliensis]|uniref:AAA family ATPase n=1 Tax=Mycolicibacter icosiumassiliensis TaxID=1792835 RepID=UPI00082B09EA|nr:AAA family ATPase [Mycolicibacter icosiumassiliensis]